MAMDNTKKKNQEYAGQVVDIARADKRFSVKDLIRPMTEQEGEPYLNVFSKSSIYLLSILTYKDSASLMANLPLTDLEAINVHTRLASAEIFRCVNGQASTRQNGETQGSNTEIPPAYQPLRVGKYKGKSAADIILAVENPNSVLPELQTHFNFLKENAEKYKMNKEDMAKIADAIKRLRAQTLESGKPEGVQNATNMAMGAIKIYTPPDKHFKKMNEAGTMNKCYSVSVLCYPDKQNPYHIVIKNYYAPLGQMKNGLKPIMRDKMDKNSYKEYTFDMTEGEWLYVLKRMNDNYDNLRMMYYKAVRLKDDELKAYPGYNA